MLRSAVTRALALSAAAAALALAAFAGPASASTLDDVLINEGNVAFGSSFAGHKADSPGTFDWRESLPNTNGQLTGNLYIENYRGKARVVIEYYPSMFDHSNPVVRRGGDKQGSGGFLDVIPVTLGGVNGAFTHVHIYIEKKDPGGSWQMAGTVPDYEDL